MYILLTSKRDKRCEGCYIEVILQLLLLPQGSTGSQVPQNKYAELLAIIEELGKEIRPTYAGSKTAMERLKRGEYRPVRLNKVW